MGNTDDLSQCHPDHKKGWKILTLTLKIYSHTIHTHKNTDKKFYTFWPGTVIGVCVKEQKPHKFDTILISNFALPGDSPSFVFC